MKIPHDCKELASRFEQAEHELIESERLNRAKSYFLAQAVHDLRQPLQAQRIFLQLLRNTELNQDQRNLLNKSIASLENMQTLMDNYLDLSRLDYGGIKYAPTCFKLSDLTDSLIEEFLALSGAEHKHLQYAPCGAEVFSDRILLERVLRNLLNNAVKFAHNMIVFDCIPDNKQVEIKITDDGCGILPDELPYIFDEFYQSGQNPEAQKKGTGLGLSIVKKISAILDIQIHVNSRPNAGSSFSFSIPLGCPQSIRC